MSDATPDVQAVVFDMDGLMFDSERLYFAACDAMLQRRGLRYTPELSHAIMGKPGLLAMETLAGLLQLPDSGQQLLDESLVVFLELLASDLQTMPGLFELLERLEQHRVPKAVATSAAWSLAEGMLARFDLIRRFQFILTCDNVTHGKPHPEIYQLACQKLGCEASRVVVLEDSANGIRAAHLAGCIPVAVPHDHARHFTYDEATLIAESLVDPRLLALCGLDAKP